MASFAAEKFMRTLIVLLTLMFALHVHIGAAASLQNTLHERCVTAIGASGQAADMKALKGSTIPLGEEGFLFQFSDAAGGTFSCQACDDINPAAVGCASLGVELSYRPKDGEMKRLPAEIDRKCTFYLQKEIALRSGGSNPFINHDVVKRIHISADNSDTRWVYNMELDGNAYRCVVRRNDGSFRVEKQTGADWRPIAAGSMF
jgi:hypothetical protein